MITLRITSSLAKKLKIKLGHAKSESTSKLGDWYAMDFRLGSNHYILCTSDKARLSIVLDAAPYMNFFERLVSELPIVLRSIGIPGVLIKDEIEQFSSIYYAKTVDRSVRGTMVEAVKALKYYFDAGDVRGQDKKRMFGFLLDTPCVALQNFPRDMVLRCFGILPAS